MNDSIITIYDENNEKKDYKLLMVIDKEYKYLVYTNIDNLDLNKDLYVVKIKELNNNEETFPINETELYMIENDYLQMINI